MRENEGPRYVDMTIVEFAARIPGACPGLYARRLVLLVLAAPLSSFAEPTMSLCIDPEPPPWAYWVRDSQGNRTTELTGISVDIVHAAFRKIGVGVVIHGNFPWARCMKMVASGQIDFAMDAYEDADRIKTFSFSRPYRTLTPYIFFRRADPVDVHNAQDLRLRHGCGLQGWSYAHYGLASGDLDLGVGMDTMVRKLKAKRCDYFVEEIETVYSAKFNGSDLLADPELGRTPAPWAKAPQCHLMTRKGSAAEALIPRINAALTDLIGSGKAAAIWQRYAPELPFSP